jgi:hypothetical protein
MKVTVNFHECSFRFTEKPPAEVLQALKAHGFRWQPISQCWMRPKGWRGLPNNFGDWLVAKAEGKEVPLINRWP